MNRRYQLDFSNLPKSSLPNLKSVKINNTKGNLLRQLEDGLVQQTKPRTLSCQDTVVPWGGGSMVKNNL